MKTSAKIGIAVIIIIIILAILFFQSPRMAHETPVVVTPIAAVSFACNDHKTIDASYSEGPATTAVAGEMPKPTGSVALVLSDGRNLKLAQTISADGTRYANPDESFVFWSKGNGALVLENNVPKSYIGCIKVMPDSGGLSEVYQNGTNGFSIRYPKGFSVDEAYSYQAMGPGTDISGVKFTIPKSLAEGTNLSTDSYISVELLPKVSTCTANPFLGNKTSQTKNVEDGTTTYSLASSMDAAAGNRYEETVYALPGTNPCIAVRYFIHYGVFENYPAGTIKEFDRTAILSQFDKIRRTLVIQ